MRRTPKGRSEAEKALDEDVRNAQALGMSYGKYKALRLARGGAPCAASKSLAPKHRKRRADLRRFEDKQAFDLWKSGLSDAKMGKSLGVSKVAIIAWRQKNNLPPQAEVKAGLAKHGDYILIVDASGEMTITRRTE